MYQDHDDWDGDEHHFNPDVHYRLYVGHRDNTPTVICVQDFDYFDYDARRILSSQAWQTEAEAEAALMDLTFTINAVSLHLSAWLDSDVRARMLARYVRESRSV